jgi:hypothetical protein
MLCLQYNIIYCALFLFEDPTGLAMCCALSFLKKVSLFSCLPARQSLPEPIVDFQKQRIRQNVSRPSLQIHTANRSWLLGSSTLRQFPMAYCYVHLCECETKTITSPSMCGPLKLNMSAHMSCVSLFKILY